MDNSEFTYKLFGVHLKQLTYKKGAHIYREGTAALGIYRILKGRVKIQKVGSKYRSIIFHLIYPSEIFGMLEFFIDKRNRHCEAVALDKEVIIQYISFSEFKDFIEKNPNELSSIFPLLMKREQVSWGKYCELHTNNTYKKVFRAIQKLAIEGGRQTDKGYALEGMSHQEIADYIGIARQSVSTTLNQLRKKNIIQYNRKQIIIPQNIRLLT